MIFSTVVGQGTSAFYEAYRGAGFDPARMPIASLTTSEAEVAQMHPEAAEGHITAAPFFETLSSATARHFVTSFKPKYGPDVPVTAAAEAAYFQVYLAMRALARCGTDDPERILAELKDLNSTRHRDGSGSIRKTTTLSFGRGSHAWTTRAVSRRSGIPACGSNPTPIVSCRASMTGLPTISRQSTVEGSLVAIQILRDLRGLRVQVVHPPDKERVSLVEHLRRIGCMVDAQWPVPEFWSDGFDVMLLAIEHDVRAEILRLLKSDGPRPTLIAVVGYEDPSTLQLVLEAGAVAVIERPIRPFGLLTNLTIARSLWLERRETKKRTSQTATQALRLAANSEGEGNPDGRAGPHRGRSL